MKQKIIYSLFFLVLPLVPLKADVKLYLIPRVFKGPGELRVMDIARIEGDRKDVEAVGREVILKSCYSDGMVDRSELYQIVREVTGGFVFIYGSASRISDGSIPRESNVSETKGSAVDLVKKGDRVKVVVIKKRMRVEVTGRATGNGSEGDEIEVKLMNNRSIRGRITGKGRVEIIL